MARANRNTTKDLLNKEVEMEEEPEVVKETKKVYKLY